MERRGTTPSSKLQALLSEAITVIQPKELKEIITSNGAANQSSSTQEIPTMIACLVFPIINNNDLMFQADEVEEGDPSNQGAK